MYASNSPLRSRRFILSSVIDDDGAPIDIDCSDSPLCSGTGKYPRTLVETTYLKNLSEFTGAGDPSLSFASN